LEENPNGAQNRRILRRGDPPQNPGDSAALKLLSILERIPHLGILRLTISTAGPRGHQNHGVATTRARQGLVVLELISADHPSRSSCGLYLRVELALEEVLAKTVEELVTQVCDELSVGKALISTLAPKGGPPPVEEVLAN
jgi:hypothetical protein